MRFHPLPIFVKNPKVSEVVRSNPKSQIQKYDNSNSYLDKGQECIYVDNNPIFIITTDSEKVKY